jgi:hypothetical protein
MTALECLIGDCLVAVWILATIGQAVCLVMQYG